MGEAKKPEDTKSSVAAIVAGILVIIAGFLAYNYFSKIGESPQKERITFEDLGEEESLEAEKFTEEEWAGDFQKQGSVMGSEDVAVEESTWVANDLVSGDVRGSSYTVKSGDTLWEIAEARYGSGFEWGKILMANADNVGYLPNGSQALIVPGQALVLPD